MKIRVSLIVTVGLTVLICLGGCGQSDAPVALEPLEISQNAETFGESAKTGINGNGQSTASGDANAKETARDAAQDQATVMVHVCGQVQNPGVYELPADARVADALLAAGDFTADADTDYWNQAAFVTDAQQIYVPSEAETAAGFAQTGAAPASGSAAGEGAGLLNINTASLQELKSLPGIGDVKAGAIVAYRESKGAFGSVEEIRQVDGIKDGVYEKIRDLICVK